VTTIDDQGRVHVREQDLNRLVEQHGAFHLDPESGVPAGILPQHVLLDFVTAELGIDLDEAVIVIDPRPLPFLDEQGRMHIGYQHVGHIFEKYADRMEKRTNKETGEEAEAMSTDDLIPLAAAEFFPGHVPDPALDSPMVLHREEGRSITMERAGHDPHPVVRST